MHIIVCVKEVIDPETPADSLRLDSERKILASPLKAPKVLNPFDEQAVEAALRIKDKDGSKITVLSLGIGLDRVVVKKPLFMGADEIVLLEDNIFSQMDSWSTASALSAAIERIGQFDLILCGRQASDWNAGQVGAGIAEMLGLPSVTVAKRIDVMDGRVRVDRVLDNGYETVEIPLPAVITVSNEIGQARYPSIKNIAVANKIQPMVWNASDLSLDQAHNNLLNLLTIFQPVHEGTCEMMEGETPQEAVENLIVAMRKAKLL
jgi:electron transfer flavoprotein beta subunit